jgi:hypothetical protein
VEDDIGEAYSTHGDEKWEGSLIGKPLGRDHLEDLDVDSIMILKVINFNEVGLEQVFSTGVREMSLGVPREIVIEKKNKHRFLNFALISWPK